MDSTHVDEPEHKSELEKCNRAMLKLQEYIALNQNAIILAGPPSLLGSLANFYKEHPMESAVIKACEHDGYKTGIHSFVQKHNHMFKFDGRGAQKHVVLQEGTLPQRKTPQHSQRQSADHARILNNRIEELRGTIRSIEVLIKDLSVQVEKLST